MTKQSFLKGTLILILAGFITRILGFINRIVIARFIGEEGVGLYMMAVPTLVLVITITQLGLPVAISKLVAEAEAQGDQRKIKKILVVSLSITGGLSVIFTPAIIFFAPLLAENIFTDERIIWPLLAITPVIPIVAISSVIRGYFQGKQNMRPAAVSQVLEQTIRISLVAICTSAFLPYGIEYAAAGAMFSSVIGELISLIYLAAMFKVKKRKLKIRRNFFTSLKKGKDTFNQLMGIALPTTGSRLIGSISWFFEPIVVANSLAIAGVATAVATKQYGGLTGYALPLLMLPSFITYSLSTSLVPAISEAMAQNKLKLVEHRLQQAIRLSIVSGGLACVVLYIFAEPLMIVMYGNSQSAIFVQVLAPFFIFHYFQGPLQAVLQALDLARAAMINSLIGSAVKTALIFALATQPSLGIMGAGLAIVIGMMLTTLLHFATVMKVVPFTIHVRSYLKSGITIVISGFIGFLCYHNLIVQASLMPRLLISICVTTFIYCLFLIIFSLIERDEMKRIPFVGVHLAKLIPIK
ncbi:stage V sporulation protein B [Metabacillus malikii]|uniref:Stage V sporulation protein B n=1 Tax=Metabacillus malikii TaxID=1504265 RepID=A0ABT9ZHR0_9BACI|nr:stage V sporulation protein B [Metabacillus malikii]MDQ0231510.1 stage V sporulation protein B [Metabacillus malikii]